MNFCPIPNCGAPRRGMQILCAACWSTVPVQLREAVWLPWHMAGGERTEEHEAAAVVAIAYAKARRERMVKRS